MKAKKAAAKRKKADAGGAVCKLPVAYYRVHALWVAVRGLSSHEDELCQLMHAIKRDGRVSPDVGTELQALLEGLAAGDVTDAVRLVESELASLPEGEGSEEKRRAKGKGHHAGR